MSIVADQVRRVDSQLDRVQLVPRTAHDGDFTAESHRVSSSPRIAELQMIVKALSSTSSSSPLLSSWRICTLLHQASLSEVVVEQEEDEYTSTYEMELEWLLVSKATVQTYGLLLSTLLEQTIPLNDDIWYWDEVLGSYAYSSLYTVQTSPLRFLAWSKDIYQDAKNRFLQLREGGSRETISARDIGSSLTDQWKQFYGLVRESIQERSVADIQQRVISPIAFCQSEARHKQLRLRRLRELGASGLGVLMDEGLSFGINDENTEMVKVEENDSHEWKIVVERSIDLMDNVLRNVTTLETGVSDFEDTVFARVEDDHEISVSGANESGATRPAKLSRRLQDILQNHVPNHVVSSQKLVSQYGRPSILVRYWLPAGVLLLSSTTILRILVSRKAEIVQWIRDLGSTMQDFWFNWIVDPTRKVISTIRHDKDSAIAIMSKESLKGDRDSLERMVVDFAIDHPQIATGKTTLSDDQISEIRMKVKEGDLTPILRAYEKDLRQPFIGTVHGDLVRTLLIQVQKTKVDVQVALSGIDSLLKSQELVFGFVGLTPGVLVCFAAFRYLSGTFGNRRGLKQGRKAGQTVRVLRNIHRILTVATPTQNSILSYKDHGLLLCEIHVLRQRASKLFPGDIEREFLEDVGDLCNINSGIQQQLRALERIKWGYSKWLS